MPSNCHIDDCINLPQELLFSELLKGKKKKKPQALFLIIKEWGNVEGSRQGGGIGVGQTEK